MCWSILLAAAASSELSSVSWEQVKSKDVPCSDDWYNAFVMVSINIFRLSILLSCLYDNSESNNNAHNKIQHNIESTPFWVASIIEEPNVRPDMVSENVLLTCSSVIKMVPLLSSICVGDFVVQHWDMVFTLQSFISLPFLAFFL